MTPPAARLKNLYQKIQQGHARTALPEIERRLRKEPRNPDLVALRAEALHRTGRHREASHAFRNAADLGGQPDCWLAAGTLLTAMRDFDDALDCLKRALSANPGDSRVLDGLIFALSVADRHNEGTDYARQQMATTQDPAYLVRAAQLLMQSGSIADDHYTECADALRKADQLLPHSTNFWGSALVAANYICDWDWSEALQHRIRDCYARGDFASPNESAFWNLMWCDDEALNLGTARNQAQRRRAGLNITPLKVEPLPAEGRRLRIGYLSCDFCDHATMHLMTGVFEYHDRGRFEIFAYDYSQPDDSEFRKRFLAAVEHHVPLDRMTDEQVATRIATDRLDVLIDLKLHTRGTRPNIIAHRPTPLIAAYLGFPGSGGVSEVDYAITDRFVTPDSSAPHWTEKFCRLPHTYQCNDRHRSVAPSSGGRAAHGLPEDAIVFASFNQSYKMDRGSFTLWMQVLAAVPDSVLWLMQQSRSARDHLLRQAQAAGIDPGRILFAPPLPSPQHRARLPLADVALDSLICNGHTTTADALWAGVPVVTTRGRHFASRVSESLLDAIGLPELVGADADDMAAIAIRIGTDAAYRQSLKQRLDDNRLTTPLFDTARFTRDFETALQMMVERQRQGLPPQHFDVPDAGPVSRTPQNPTNPPEPAPAVQPSAARLTPGVVGEPSPTTLDSAPRPSPCGSSQITHQHWSRVIERVIAQLRAHGSPLPVPGKPLWLDLGCGEGELLRYAGGAGFGGIGLDTDAARVTRLQQQGSKALATPDLAAGFLSIDLSGNVSVISLMAPLPDDANLSPVLAHAAKALHPGGVLVLSMRVADPDRLAALLNEHGFDVVPVNADSAAASTAGGIIHAVRRAPDAAAALPKL